MESLRLENMYERTVQFHTTFSLSHLSVYSAVTEVSCEKQWLVTWVASQPFPHDQNKPLEPGTGHQLSTDKSILPLVS